jgi:hypothetical protein
MAVTPRGISVTSRAVAVATTHDGHFEWDVSGRRRIDDLLGEGQTLQLCCTHDFHLSRDNMIIIHLYAYSCN